jgi:hypothetical protein
MDGPKPYDANGYDTATARGIPQPGFVREVVVDDLQKQFVLRDTDIVIATYPKCGTTWMQQILLTLQYEGDKTKVPRPLSQSPWIENVTCSKFLKIPRGFQSDPRSVQELLSWDGSTEFAPPPGRRVFKTHATVELAPWKGGVQGLRNTKVVVVTRNPKDACVSMFHHSRDTEVFHYRGDFQHFASDLFLKGNVESGCFWAWHAGWQRAAEANKANVVWVSYEELKEDPAGTIRRLADFLGIPASDDTILRTVGASSFSSIKSAFAQADQQLLQQGKRTKKNHIRQGEMGSWRSDIYGALLVEFDAVHTLKCSEHALTYKFNFGAGEHCL